MTAHNHNFEPQPEEVPYLTVVARFAAQSLAAEVPAAEIVRNFCSVAFEIALRTIGPVAAKAMVDDIAREFTDYASNPDGVLQ